FLVAVEALDRRLLHVPVPAVDLQRPVRDSVRELAGEELRHRRLPRERPALVLQPRRTVDERTTRLDLGCHVREPELDRLERGDRLPELLPLPRIFEREVVCALRAAGAHRGDRDPSAVESLEELLEPRVSMAW